MTNGTSSERILTDDERQILQGICDEAGIPCAIVEQMIVAENLVYGMGRRHGIWETLQTLVDKGVGEATQNTGGEK